MSEGTIGKIFSSKSLFMRLDNGTGTTTDDHGNVHKYELSLNAGGGHPIIRSLQTGNWWTISWEEMLNLAVEAGIENPIEEETDEDPRARGATPAS